MLTPNAILSLSLKPEPDPSLVEVEGVEGEGVGAFATVSWPSEVEENLA